MGAIREINKKDGTVTYHAEVRIRGTHLGGESFRTRTLAKKWIQDVESSIRDGRHFRTAESKKHTVGELIDRFIEQWLPKYPKHQAKQKAHLFWWKGELGHLLLSDLTSIYHRRRDKLLAGITYRKTQRSGGTVNRYLAAFSKALSVALKEWQWMEDNPMSKVSKPSESQGRSRFLNEEEIRRLLHICKQSSNTYLYAIVKIALLSAMRYGEIIHLRWRDIDFIQRVIVLEVTKNGDRRIIPLTEEMEAVFKECSSYGCPIGDYVFPSRRRVSKKPVGGIRYAFAKALQDSEIQSFKFHDLRHTAASHMAMNGGTQGELMAILGHRSPHMTRRYAHFSQKHLATLMERTQIKLLKEVNNESEHQTSNR